MFTNGVKRGTEFALWGSFSKCTQMFGKRGCLKMWNNVFQVYNDSVFCRTAGNCTYSPALLLMICKVSVIIAIFDISFLITMSSTN